MSINIQFGILSTEFVRPGLREIAAPLWGVVGCTHLPFLQQPSQRALADDVAPTQEEAHSKSYHHGQQETAHNPGGNGGDPGPGARWRHIRE